MTLLKEVLTFECWAAEYGYSHNKSVCKLKNKTVSKTKVIKLIKLMQLKNYHSDNIGIREFEKLASRKKSVRHSSVG